MSAVEKKVALRRVELSKSPPGFLLIDRSDGVWRGAFWRLREPHETPEGSPAPSPLVWDQAVARGDVSAEAKREAWVRVAAVSAYLADLCFALFERSRHEPGSVAAYLEAIL